MSLLLIFRFRFFKHVSDLIFYVSSEVPYLCLPPPWIDIRRLRVQSHSDVEFLVLLPVEGAAQQQFAVGVSVQTAKEQTYKCVE